MKSKKMRSYLIIPTLILGGIFILSGCDKSNDVYNPKHLQEEAKKAFPVKDIDPNQTWETSAICNASVTVSEKTGETYTIKVYTANPYNTDGNAYLLAKTNVTDGQTTNFKFDIPTTLQYVYVMKVNNEGYSSAVPVAVENGNVKVTFGGEATTQRMATTRSVTKRTNIWEPDVLNLDNTDLFPKSAPANSKEYNGQWNIEEGGNYIITSTTTNINCDKAANFYIKGNIALSNFYFGGSKKLSKLFILPEATLTVQDLSLEMNIQIHTSKNGTLKCNNINLSNSCNTVYNAGIIEATGTYYDSRNKGIFYNLGTLKFSNANLKDTYFNNEGTIIANDINNNNSTNFINGIDAKINLTGKFSVENASTIAVNNGEITAAAMSHGQESSTFYNESTGKVTITGETKVGSNNSTWDNQGYFRTKTMEFGASSANWYNKCKLYVDETLIINTGNGRLLLDAGSYTECSNLEMDMSRVEMGEEAFFNVLNIATLKWNESNNGFHATGDKYALLKMNKATPFGNSLQNVHQTYNGKLYIACDNHFEIGGSWWYYQITNGAQMTGTDNANIKIPASTCNPGYNSTPDGGGENDKAIEYAYAFEDMMTDAGDYDFNDVVLSVTTPYKKDGKQVIDVTLKAAGATKKLAVLFKNGTTTTTLFENVHTALNVPEGTIVNTGGATGTPRTVTIEVGANFNLTNNGDFYISDGKREVHIPNFTPDFAAGDVPYALRIASANWEWPKEKIQITEAYPDFADWANNAMEAPDWYKNFQSDKVVRIE